MATIKKRSGTGAPVWQVRIRIAGTRHQTKSFPTEADAKAFAKIEERKIRSGQSPTLASLIDATSALAFQNEKIHAVISLFLASRKCAPRYKEMGPTVLGNLVDIKVEAIRRSWIKSYIEDMRTKTSNRNLVYSWATLHGHAGFIRMAIKWRAMELDLPAPHFPYSAADLMPKRWAKQRDRRLHAEEESALMRQIESDPTSRRAHWLLLVRLALASGARLQEMVLAEWRHVDYGLSEWTLPLENTKSKKERVVPFSRDIARIMAELKALALPGESHLFHTLPNPHQASNMLGIMIRKAGLVDFRFHDMRHEAITRMILYKRKLSPFEIMKIVGHESLEMLNRYANLRGSDLLDRMD